MLETGELSLALQADAVPTARRFVRRSLQGAPQVAVEDAELVVTELVTNAVLHGAAPVTVRVGRVDERVRLEVGDTGQQMPVRPRHSTEAMTGRGLELVAALSASWGVIPGATGGKVIWAELAGDTAAAGEAAPEVDLDALLAAWQDDELAEELFTVRLGSVPTDLLLAAKSHIDNVVRELTLARADAEATGVEPPAPFARLIKTVTREFASARADIKRQALAAAARGDVETELVLSQPASAAAAGEAYLAALDEADRYARAARLLTLETPQVHRVFRRWYVQALVDRLRALSSGQVPPRTPTLVEVLADEVADLAGLRRGWDRLQVLQAVTAELTGARTVEEMAQAVVARATDSVGALSARVYVLDGALLRSVGSGGGSPAGLQVYAEIPMDSDLPGPLVVRSGEPMVLRTKGQLGERFPVLEGLFEDERVLHVAPLTIGDHRLGVLSMSFPGGGEVDEQTQTAFVRALADLLAQAMERALAMTAADEAHARLAFLADASVALSASLDHQETVDAVARLLVPRLADFCLVQVMERGELRTIGFGAAGLPELPRADELRPRRPGGPGVPRSPRSELYRELPDELLQAVAADQAHLEALRALGLSSGLVLPLTGRRGVFGVIALFYADPSRHYTVEDIPFAEDIARRAALAIETAQVLRDQSGRLADVTRVAEAAQHAILAAPPEQIGPVALAARYVSAAAEALVGGDLYEVVARPGAVRLLIGDVRGKGLAAVRTATIVLGEFRAAAADLEDLAEVARQLDRRLRPYLGPEDFVTALVAEIQDDGRCSIASCGHPSALHASGGNIRRLRTPPALPLGLGAEPVVTTVQLVPGDRLLLYTDGVVEARDASGSFVDVPTLVRPLTTAGLDVVLDEILTALNEAVGHDLGDDLALLVAEFRGPRP
ncbi:MAG: hypothetical protein JWN57_2835 [Frankiales bacterium]|nr:hypothetical protein [Frankiales bacterium]